MAVHDPREAWRVLGLEVGEADRRAIKKAYATMLRKHRPEDDPAGFRDVRDAYELLTEWGEDALRAYARDDDEDDRWVDGLTWLGDDGAVSLAGGSGPSAAETGAPVEERWSGPPPSRVDHERSETPAPDPRPAAPEPEATEPPPDLEGVDLRWRASLLAAFKRPAPERANALRAAMAAIVGELDDTHESRTRYLTTLAKGFPPKAHGTLAALVPPELVTRALERGQSSLPSWTAFSLASHARTAALERQLGAIEATLPTLEFNPDQLAELRDVARLVAIQAPDAARGLVDTVWEQSPSEIRRYLDLEETDALIRIGKETAFWRPTERALLTRVAVEGQLPDGQSKALIDSTRRAIMRTQPEADVRMFVQELAPVLARPPRAERIAMRRAAAGESTGGGGSAMPWVWIVIIILMGVRGCSRLTRDDPAPRRDHSLEYLREQQRRTMDDLRNPRWDGGASDPAMDRIYDRIRRKERRGDELNAYEKTTKRMIEEQRRQRGEDPYK